MPTHKTPERIRRAALELFGRKGIAGTTVQEIAGRAGCSQAALYKHWDGKDALARELFETSHRDLLEAMDQGAAHWEEASERVLGALIGFVRFARLNASEYALLFQVYHSDYAKWLAGHDRPSDRIALEIREGMGEGAIPEGDAMVKAALVLGMAIRLAFFERQGLIREDPARTEEELSLAAAAVLGV